MKKAEAASPFEDLAINRLKQAGYRITMPRVQVIRALASSVRALSAYGIHDSIVSGGGRIDVVSVYRILTTLVELGLVHHIGIVDGYLACSLDHDHHERMEHIVCGTCGSVQEVEVPRAAITATELQLTDMGFQASNIKIEILGNCKLCLAAQ